VNVDVTRAFTFENFVVGENTRLAVAAARTVSESPGSSYNPLFIYGPTGLGKTHLLRAIGRRAQELDPGVVVEYATLDEFVDAYQHAVQAGEAESFHQRFSRADILLLDDVQFLRHSREMQAELLKLATQLQAADRELVLTSDRPPAEIEELDDRLLEQLGGGLVVDIGSPDYETRFSILKQRSEEQEIGLDPAIIDAVAKLEIPHVRALLGVLVKLQALQSVNEKPLSVDEALKAIEGQVPKRSPESAPPDEFGQFMDVMSVTLTQQVKSWSSHIREAADKWTSAGFDTKRLEALLQEDGPTGTDAAVKRFERDVEKLQSLRVEMQKLDADAADAPVFFDPDRLPEAEAAVRDAKEKFNPPPGPSDAFEFSKFVQGQSTNMAVESARKVIAQPGEIYNPFVVVGASGVGKTHLLHGVGNELTRQGLTVACLSAKTFVDDYVQAEKEGTVSEWRARYRNAAAFLLDEVQHIGGNSKVQEEVFNLFNLFSDSKRQLIFTLDVSPSDVQGLEERLVSRLVSGLVANIEPPDSEIRKVVVTQQLELRVGMADGQLVEFLALQPCGSMRSLLNDVRRVLDAAEAAGVQPTAEQAKRFLESSSGATTGDVAVTPARNVIAAPAGIRSPEKVVWEWPRPTDRLVEAFK